MSAYTFMNTATDAGDSMTLIAVTIVCGLLLRAQGNPRAALALAASLAAAAGIAVLKIAVFGCGLTLYGAAVKSPSGHVALSTAVYGMLALLASRGKSGWQAWAPPPLAAGLVALIALTRVKLGFHNTVEIAIGFLVGTVALGMAYWVFLCRREMAPADARLLGFSALTIIILAAGIRLPAEILIDRLALDLKLRGLGCVQITGATPAKYASRG